MLAMSSLDEALKLLPHLPAAADGGGGSTTPTILIRFTAILTLTTLSIWANHEASKGIEISILYSVATTTAVGHRFDLMFISNGRTTQIIHTTTTSVILYPTRHFSSREFNKSRMVLWVFGYGSLVWNPGFDYGEKTIGFNKDYRRDFDLACIDHRKTSDNPARTCTLDIKLHAWETLVDEGMEEVLLARRSGGGGHVCGHLSAVLRRSWRSRSCSLDAEPLLVMGIVEVPTVLVEVVGGHGHGRF